MEAIETILRIEEVNLQYRKKLAVVSRLIDMEMYEEAEEQLNALHFIQNDPLYVNLSTKILLLGD